MSFFSFMLMHTKIIVQNQELIHFDKSLASSGARGVFSFSDLRNFAQSA